MTLYVPKNHKNFTACFICYPRDAMLARVFVIGIVCLSVRPSHAGIVSKRRKKRRDFFIFW